MKKNYFPENEWQDIGDTIENMNVVFLGQINQHRDEIGVPMKMLYNGATKGKHSAEEHPLGRALDFYYLKPVPILEHILTAVKCGLNGIGIYVNEKGYLSYHLDNRPKTTFWFGTKTNKNDNWTYTNDLFEFLSNWENIERI